jgi:hypothetical protein
MHVFDPKPFRGGCRWTASPRQKLERICLSAANTDAVLAWNKGTHILPSEYLSATVSLINHFEMLRIFAGVSSPIKSRTLFWYSSFNT